MEIYFGIILLIVLLKYFKIINTKSIKIGIKEINNTYIELFTEKNLMVKLTQIFLIFVGEICSFIVIYHLFFYHISKYINMKMNYMGLFLLVILFCAIFHYTIGFLLLMSSNLHKYMCRNLEESMKGKFLLSYFLISVFLVLLILIPDELSKYAISGFLSIGISYIIDVNLLIKFMRNPRYIKVNSKDRYSFSKILILALIIIILLILNLFILVSLVNMSEPNAYSNNPSYFDLFYYTIVTFTTIGFGDVVPVTILAKFITVLISFTSILCMTIFVGSIYSNRKK